MVATTSSPPHAPIVDVHAMPRGELLVSTLAGAHIFRATTTLPNPRRAAATTTTIAHDLPLAVHERSRTPQSWPHPPSSIIVIAPPKQSATIPHLPGLVLLGFPDGRLALVERDRVAEDRHLAAELLREERARELGVSTTTAPNDVIGGRGGGILAGPGAQMMVGPGLLGLQDLIETPNGDIRLPTAPPGIPGVARPGEVGAVDVSEPTSESDVLSSLPELRALTECHVSSGSVQHILVGRPEILMRPHGAAKLATNADEAVSFVTSYGSVCSLVVPADR